MDDAYGYWLAGLIDGEGSFHLKTAKGTWAKRSYCCFSIELRDDDAAILREIQERTGIGTLSRRQARVGRRGHSQISWKVQDQAGCTALKAILEKYPLRTKKRNSLVIWGMALDEQLGEHRTETMEGYRMALKLVHQYGG